MEEKKTKLYDDYWENDSNLSDVNLNDFSLPQVKDLLLCGKKFLQKFDFKKSNILDIGGGSGKTSRYYGLQNNGNKLYVIDIAPSVIEIANKMGCIGCVLDIEKDKFPYDDSFFDFIIFQEVAEHLYSLNNVLTECKRILKPGGM
ncbi:MAG TPA: class I SAM-dependent methyltransferase, partial [Candidatus Paceibacterota bacterium]